MKEHGRVLGRKSVACSRTRDGIEWNESDGRERPLHGRVNDSEAVNEREELDRSKWMMMMILGVTRGRVSV